MIAKEEQKGWTHIESGDEGAIFHLLEYTVCPIAQTFFVPRHRLVYCAKGHPKFGDRGKAVWETSDPSLEAIFASIVWAHNIEIILNILGEISEHSVMVQLGSINRVCRVCDEVLKKSAMKTEHGRIAQWEVPGHQILVKLLDRRVYNDVCAHDVRLVWISAKDGDTVLDALEIAEVHLDPFAPGGLGNSLPSRCWSVGKIWGSSELT